MRPVPWRVRVKRAEEVWVDVAAVSAIDAEIEAAKLPRVLAVFNRSAIRADEKAPEERPAGVSE
jgi:hypothetical protein